MDIYTKIAWLALAAVHVAPAAVSIRPSPTARPYGVAPADDVGVLLAHRGALFLWLVALAPLVLVLRDAWWS